MASFFFSSRGRHTRDIGDWSSDVCSSDLAATRHKVYPPRRVNFMARGCGFRVEFHWKSGTESASRSLHRLVRPLVRSEERRVGKECRWRGRGGHGQMMQGDWCHSGGWGVV